MNRFRTRHRNCGVTLLEMVLVVVVVAVAAVSLGGLFTTAVRGLPGNEQLQSAGQLAQACAERVYAARHAPGFVFEATPASLAAAHCGLPAGAAAYALTLTEAAQPLPAAVCPAGLLCRHLVVQVSHATTAGFATRLDFLLVEP